MFPAKIAGLLCLWPFLAWAASDEAYLCETAALQAAADSNVPPSVMRALTLVETGRAKNGAFRPWPWTVNMEGKGYWFATRAEAVTFVTDSYANGARSFDIGCFQINHRWHGQAFNSFDQMFDPNANARYAAQFIATLYAESGSWETAAGAYHSRSETLAAGYRERFARIQANLDAAPTQTPNLPVVTTSAAPTVVARLSTWDPFARSTGTASAAPNGSLAGGLASTGVSLLTAANGALF